MFASKYFAPIVSIMFIVGIIAATFNSADSAMTSIATIFFVDILKKDDNNHNNIFIRKLVYFCVCVAFIIIVLLFDNIKNKNLLDTIYTIVGYAYGPLLGLFAFGLFTKWQIRDRLLPITAILSPIFTYFIYISFRYWFDYKFGYELLLINGLLMFVMLIVIKKQKHDD